MTLLEVATSTSAKDLALSMFRRNSTFGGSTIFTLRWMCFLLQIFRTTLTHKPYYLRDHFPKINVLKKYSEQMLFSTNIMKPCCLMKYFPQTIGTGKEVEEERKEEERAKIKVPN